jgi:rhodanese-related sulfurtransferase
MGKGRKNRNPQPGPASAPAQAVAPTPAAPPSASVAPASTARRIALQFAALLGLSAALGFTFNAANPIGVRFGGSSVASLDRAGGPTDFNLLSASNVAAAPPLPTAPPTPQPAARPTAPPPSLKEMADFYQPTAAAPSLSRLSNPPPTVTVTPAPTNPAAIHWREAKPLVAAGLALLLDVRLAPVYDAGHIPDAISLPEASTAEMINAFLEKVPTNLTLIVYCSSTTCSQSKRVADRLVGIHKWGAVKYMTGGYLEYQQEELAGGQSQP